MMSTRAAVAVVAAGALVAALGFASVGAAGSGPCEHRGKHHRPPGKFIEKNAERLGLDPEKTGEIRAMLEESYAESEGIHAQLREARRSLHELLAEDLPDRDQVMKQVEKIGELEIKAEKHKLDTMLEVRAMLSEEQRAELVEIRREKRERRFAPMHEACAGDFERLCPDIEPGRELFRCLRQSSEELSDTCREAIQAKHSKYDKHGKCKQCGKEGGCEEGCERCGHH
ncbi:MAG: Spy/CpxP family protein refolding chaperone [Myxococcales bacterium]|nr:Spy/CpxP family protein refolding chaperone [Myxococcales bacterium]